MIDIMVNMNFYMYIITLSMDNKLATGFIHVVVGFFVIVRIILHIHALSERCERPTCTFAFCKILLV